MELVKNEMAALSSLQSLNDALIESATSDFETYRKKSQDHFIKLTKRRIIWSRDGLNLDDDTSFIPRDSVIRRLEKSLLEQRAILIRAPPASGKTSTSQLLYRHLYGNPDYLPILINCLKCNKSMTFEDQFASVSGLNANLDTVLSACEEKKVVVVVDEAQMLYSHITTGIWSSLKTAIADNLYFVFFAVYGERVRNSETSAPLEFSKSAIFGLDSLLLDRCEFDQLVPLLSSELVGHTEAQNRVFESCGGHIGLVTTVFNELADYGKACVQVSGDLHLPEEKILTFLMSPRLADAVRGCRSFALDSYEANATVNLIAKMFLSDETVEYDPTQHDKYIKSGIFVVKEVDTTRLIMFSAPLIRRAFITMALSSRSVQTWRPFKFHSLQEFIMACLGALKRDTLRASNSVSTAGHLNEAMFKMEFYFVASQLLCGRARIDPEVGQIFKTDGNALVDFYVNGEYRWLIEFLVGSDRLGEHLRRFEDGGKYKKIPCKQFAVVDFVMRSSLAEKPNRSRFRDFPEYFRVIYDNSLTAFSVENQDKETIIELN